MRLERIEKRARRRRRVRSRIRGSGAKPRLSVYRSLHHIYAQVISDDSGRTLAAVSTLAPVIREDVQGRRSIATAKLVGKAIAERCLQKGISRVTFDRNGFLYHGKIKALADAAREAGLKF